MHYELLSIIIIISLSQNNYDDATIACDGQLYPVHKLVLSSCSEYFEQMFLNTHGKHPIIVLHSNIKVSTFEALLQYMYLGEVNVVQEKLSELISAADCLKIKGLAVSDDSPVDESFHSSNRNKRKQEYCYSSNETDLPSKAHKSLTAGGISRSSTLSSQERFITPVNSHKSNGSISSSKQENVSQDSAQRVQPLSQPRSTSTPVLEPKQITPGEEDEVEVSICNQQE